MDNDKIGGHSVDAYWFQGYNPTGLGMRLGIGSVVGTPGGVLLIGKPS